MFQMGGGEQEKTLEKELNEIKVSYQMESSKV